MKKHTLFLACLLLMALSLHAQPPKKQIGLSSKAQGMTTTAMGEETKASGKFSTAMGYYTKASGQSSTAMGEKTEASGKFSTTMGNETEAIGENSIAMGFKSKASGKFSTTMGYMSIASGERSTAMGNATEALGVYSTAMGLGSKASGAQSTAMGEHAKAIGTGSTAMGRHTEASGAESTAMGEQTKASGMVSTAMGRVTEASGYASTAMGHGSVASGKYSTAMGQSTKANADNSTVIGTNIELTSTAKGSMFLGDASRSGGNLYSKNTPNRFHAVFDSGYTLYTNGTPGNNYGVSLIHNSNSWATISDRNKKENVKIAEGNYFIESIKKMDLGSWNYIGQDAKKHRHYGAMAQDFHKYFGHDGIGTIGNDTTIASADIDGVMMIAIQQLARENDALKAELKAQKELTIAQQLDFNDQTAQYIKDNGEMEERLSKIEALIQQTEPEIKYVKR